MRKLVTMQCIPVLVDVDEDGEFLSAPYTPQVQDQQGNMQSIAFNVPAKEWKDGWDWESALERVFEQMNGQVSQEQVRELRSAIKDVEEEAAQPVNRPKKRPKKK